MIQSLVNKFDPFIDELRKRNLNVCVKIYIGDTKITCEIPKNSPKLLTSKIYDAMAKAKIALDDLSICDTPGNFPTIRNTTIGKK